MPKIPLDYHPNINQTLPRRDVAYWLPMATFLAFTQSRRMVARALSRILYR